MFYKNFKQLKFSPIYHIPGSTAAFFLISSFFFVSCFSHRVYDHPGPDVKLSKIYYSSLKAEYIIKGKKEKAKILLKYNEQGDRLIFLGIFNQVLFEIIVRNEKCLLLVRKKKKYWKGDFSEFCKILWNIRIKYAELKKLVYEGLIPESVNGNTDLKISVSTNGRIRTTLFAGNNYSLKIRVKPVKTKFSFLDLRRDIRGFSKIWLKRDEVYPHE